MATPILNISNLNLLIGPIQREVAPPGEFSTVYPNGDDDTLFAYLCDGFGEAQMDGFLGELSLDWVTGDITPSATFGEAALVTIYSAMRIIRTQIMLTATTGSSVYKAGPVEYSTTLSNSILRDVLDNLEKRKLQLIKTNLRVTAQFLDSYRGRLDGARGNEDYELLSGITPGYFFYWAG